MTNASRIESGPPVQGNYANSLEEKIYLALNTPHTSPARVLDSDTMRESMPKIERLHSEIPPPSYLSDDVVDTIESTMGVLANLKQNEATADLYSILALVLRTHLAERDGARETRFAGRQNSRNISDDIAQKMREAAHARMVGAMASGALQIAGGVVGIGAGMVTAGAGTYSASISGDPALAASATALNFIAQGSDSIGKGVSGPLGAIGGMVNAYQENEASEIDAKKTELEAVNRMQEQVTQERNEHMQQMLDVMRDSLDKARSLEQSRSEINRTLARGV